MLTNKNWVPIVLMAFSKLRLAVAVCGAVLLVGCQPPGPKSLLLGEKYLEKGDYERALKYLNRASDLMPEHPQVWNYLGLAYHGSGQPAVAVEKYQRAIRIDRNLPAPHYNLGVLLLEQNHLPQAVAELNTFVTLQTNSSIGWTKLGTALLRFKRPDDAERAFVQATRIDPKNAEAYNGLGLAHIQRKRPREAMLAFNSALQYRTGYSSALLNQAIIAQQHFGNKQMALERYRAYLSTKPDAKSAAQVQQAVAALEREINGVETAEASAPAAPQPETNAVASFLRSNATTRTVQVASNPPIAPATTNLIARLSPGKTNVIAHAAPTAQTNTVAAHSAPAANASRRATNAVAAARPIVTNTPPPVVTAAVPPTNVVSAPVVVAAKTERAETESIKTETEAEAEVEAVEVEVVNVDKEPDFKPVADFAEVKPSTQAGAAKNSAAAEQRPLLVLRRDRKQEEEKPGLLTRVNPVRWFKRDNEKPTEEPTPPPVVKQETSPPPRPSYPPVTKVTDPKPEPPRVIARYQYRKSAPIKAGNRAAAQKIFQQGAEAHQRRRLAEAMEAYQNATLVDPSFYDAHYNLGIAAYQSKNLPLALSANETALAVQPKSKEARYNFALTLRDANYPADAANELRTLVEEHPDEVRAHFALANIYAQQLDQPALARRHYLAVLELSPKHSDAGLIRQWLAANQ